MAGKSRKEKMMDADEKIIRQIETFGRSDNLMTVDTVKGFLTDSKKSKFKI